MRKSAPLVHEPSAVHVDDDAEGVGVLLVEVGDLAVAEGGRVEVPGDGVASAPVAEGLRADVEGHADAVAGVELGPAHLRRRPGRTQMALAHLGVRLEAARRQHDRARSDGPLAVGEARGHAGDAALAGLEADRRGVVCHGDAGPPGELEEPVGEADSAADCLDD